MILIYYSAGGADCDHDVMKWFMKNWYGGRSLVPIAYYGATGFGI